MNLATEVVPLWNPLSITTLVIASVGAAVGVVSLWLGYQRDHPRVVWRAHWVGPVERINGEPIVNLAIENHGSAAAHRVSILVGENGRYQSGDGWDLLAFGEEASFSFTLAENATIHHHEPAAGSRGHPVRKTLNAKIHWYQEPNLHRRRTKRIRRTFFPGQLPVSPSRL